MRNIYKTSILQGNNTFVVTGYTKYKTGAEQCKKATIRSELQSMVTVLQKCQETSARNE